DPGLGLDLNMDFVRKYSTSVTVG
ncbi:MAG: hypothetical protein KDH19_14875, partial [Geminicoccaceae bacterium]|nr:hypothetical protein [Geminicoccaceae bacterium]